MQSIIKVQYRSTDLFETDRVNQYLTTRISKAVVAFGRQIKFHAILHSGTPALGNKQPQALVWFCTPRKFRDFMNSWFGEFNHAFQSTEAHPSCKQAGQFSDPSPPALGVNPDGSESFTPSIDPPFPAEFSSQAPPANLLESVVPPAPSCQGRRHRCHLDPQYSLIVKAQGIFSYRKHPDPIF
jgi:hypothetical protein